MRERFSRVVLCHSERSDDLRSFSANQQSSQSPEMFLFTQHDKLVTERNVDVTRGMDELAIRRDEFKTIDCFGDRDVTDFIVLVAHH